MSTAWPAPSWRPGAPVTTFRCTSLTGGLSTRRPVWRATQSICSDRTAMWRSPTHPVRRLPSNAIAPSIELLLVRRDRTDSLGSYLRLIRPFRPQTNGMVERFNRRLAEHLDRRPQLQAHRRFRDHADRDA